MMKNFRSILGKENVIIYNNNESFQSTTFFTNKKVLGMIYPTSKEDIQECIKVSNQQNIKVYPISTGKNIGFGGKIPTDDYCVIMNLIKMNKIIEYNEILAYVRIEPGVTQKQLVDFLKKNNSKLMLSVTGSFEDSSIIGNCLERGNTLGPLLERADQICNLGVVLASGDYINTGYGRFDNSKVKHLNKHGLGPDISGLFIQSNLGIVSEMTIWLTPISKVLDNIVFSLSNFKQLENTLDKIRDLKLHNIINEVFLWNDYKLLSLIQRYPFDLITQTPLPKNLFIDLKHKFYLSQWNGSITLRSNSQFNNYYRKYQIYKAISKSVNLIISTKSILFKIGKFISPLINLILNINLRHIFKITESPFFAGITSNMSIKSLYWRKKNILEKTQVISRSLDPEKDKVGFIWCDVVLPLLGKEISKTIQGVNDIIINNSFEPILGILCVNKRYALLVTAIIYDRETSEEDKKAMNCHNKLLKFLIEQGHHPSRLGIQSMDKMNNGQKTYEKFLKTLKKHMDSQEIISPGRYDFTNKTKYR